MWARYRKLFIPTQLVIVTVSAMTYFLAHMPAQSVVTFFLLMQAFAVLGAMWGVRLQGKAARAKKRKGELPKLMD